MIPGMATQTQGTAAPAPRRVLLIDFDWKDADLIPELFREPGVSVRLVAGDGPHDAGIRVAEMCGLPRTLDLADLTREIFDVALIGERSSRRTQLEGLLVALGTPCVTPEEFLRGRGLEAQTRPGVDAPLELHAAALEHSLGGAFEALVDDALPELGEETPLAPRPIEPVTPPRIRRVSMEDFPSAETRRHLEETLKSLVTRSGAGTAEVHAGDRSQMRLMAKIGPEDRLLSGLVDLANEMGTPQMVTRLTDPGRGRTWAAGPFRTMQRRGVLAGASIDASEGLASWQNMLEELRTTWDKEDRDRSAQSYPLTPNRETRWLEPQGFLVHAEMAVERHRRDHMRFELHRFEFPREPAAVDRMCLDLPAQIRDIDHLVRPFPHVVALLAAGEPETFAQLRRRLLALWERAWRAAGNAPPATPFVDRKVELAGPEDADGFLTAAGVWLAEP